MTSHETKKRYTPRNQTNQNDLVPSFFILGGVSSSENGGTPMIAGWFLWTRKSHRSKWMIKIGVPPWLRFHLYVIYVNYQLLSSKLTRFGWRFPHWKKTQKKLREKSSNWRNPYRIVTLYPKNYPMKSPVRPMGRLNISIFQFIPNLRMVV